MQAHPGLRRYKRFFTGSCCRAQSDEKIRPRLRGFILKNPEWEEVLRPLVGAPGA